VAEDTDFLYPFIEGDERDAGALLVDLASSVEAKVADGDALRVVTFAGAATEVNATARSMADRFQRGGRLFTFGNGGSATDARSLASLFACPPHGRPLPARCLADDTAVVTALANDVGFELVFVRQLIAHAGADDIALGFSTSGNSRNLLAAFEHAARTGLLGVGFAGYDGGEMRDCGDLDACFVVGSDSVHRIQEVQAALAWRLWSEVQACLDQGDATGA
jgi:D-sedoheptulose 7-phosphate isomerase